MGDRANIRLDEPAGSIHLYTHWGGDTWPERLRVALDAARTRWDDEPYRNRIIIGSVFSDLTGTTGGGVSIAISDGGDRVVCVSGNEVWAEGSDDARWQIEEYIGCPDHLTWDRVRSGPNA